MEKEGWARQYVIGTQLACNQHIIRRKPGNGVSGRLTRFRSGVSGAERRGVPGSSTSCGVWELCRAARAAGTDARETGVKAVY